MKKQQTSRRPKLVRRGDYPAEEAKPFGIYRLTVVRGIGHSREENEIEDTNYDDEHNDALEILATCDSNGTFHDIKCTSRKRYSGGKVISINLEGQMSRSTNCGPSEMPFSGTISRPYYDKLSWMEYNKLGRPQTVMRTVNRGRAIYVGYTTSEMDELLKRK